MRTTSTHLTRAQRAEAGEDIPTNKSTAPTLDDVVAARVSRRGALKLAAGVAALGATSASPLALFAGEARAMGAPRVDFEEISHGVDETHHVANGYSADILIRWGDPVLAGAPEFDPMNQTAETQAQQFGYNNDFLGFFPLPMGSGSNDRGLLCVNHEYTSEEVMFPGINGRQDKSGFPDMNADLVAIEMAAHGGTVIEVEKLNGQWRAVPGAALNRRITASTPMRITGPAAGHARMATSADPDGTTVLGTFNNCAGGVTPWGTWLMAEENFNYYFMGEMDDDNPEKASHARLGLPGNGYVWGEYEDRFDVAKEPNEGNRHGWMVEVDPYDPTSTPKKRTALGRFKHEGGGVQIARDGRVVVYMGDDQRFDYLYKFVTAKAYDPSARGANMDLLDEGTLYVARFDADGSVVWLPLKHGLGPLTAENGFNNQGDVVIEARRAGDLLGATPMDRPEDVEADGVSGRVYVMLTNNSKRKEDQVDGPNPRGPNAFGQILEIAEDNGDLTASHGRWDLLVRCGDPANPEHGASWGLGTSENGWFASPDNCVFDHHGRFWVTTDQGSGWAKSGTADGVWAVETDGAARGSGRMFFRVPLGAEMCGPCFTPDDATLFVAVQHPATDGVDKYEPFGRKSTFEDPATRWPDFQDGVPPRPSVVTITRNDGGVIGGEG